MAHLSSSQVFIRDETIFCFTKTTLLQGTYKLENYCFITVTVCKISWEVDTAYLSIQAIFLLT